LPVDATTPPVNVLCVGECMVELSEAPSGGLTRAFGGDTLNTALYLARLGVAVQYVTALGVDPFSDEMIAAWRAEGIGTDLIARVAGTLPGLYLIRTDAQGERSFHYWRDSAPVRRLFRLPEIDAIEAAFAAAGMIYLSGITLSLFDDASRARLFTALAAARTRGARIVFDTNFRPRGWPDADAARLVYERAFRSSDLVLASVEDHCLLFGSSAPADVIARLRDAGVAEMVVKFATPACQVVTAACDEIVTAAPVAEVIDTTAAGDSFAAAYMAARLAGHQPAAAAGIGHQLAGAVVRHRGAIIPCAAMPAITLTPEAA